MSYQDFMNEPYDVYETNKFIMEEEADNQLREARKAQRMAKRSR